MKKFARFLIAYLTFLPGAVLASPGSLDQFGGHYCQDNCAAYDLAQSEYHYHELAGAPGFLKGSMAQAQIDQLSYLAKVAAGSLVSDPKVLNDNTPAINSAADNQLCQGRQIFSEGRYDQNGKVRVPPVCADDQGAVLADKNIAPVDYYQNLKMAVGDIAEKAYHVEFHNDGRKAFTDRPEIGELADRLIQGETDAQIYRVEMFAGSWRLLPISLVQAANIYGQDYRNQIVYFDDAIVYSYHRGI